MSPPATAAPPPRATKTATAARIVAGCFKLLMVLPLRRHPAGKGEVKRRTGPRISSLRTGFPHLWPKKIASGHAPVSDRSARLSDEHGLAAGQPLPRGSQLRA